MASKLDNCKENVVDIPETNISDRFGLRDVNVQVDLHNKNSIANAEACILDGGKCSVIKQISSIDKPSTVSDFWFGFISSKC